MTVLDEREESAYNRLVFVGILRILPKTARTCTAYRLSRYKVNIDHRIDHSAYMRVAKPQKRGTLCQENEKHRPPGARAADDLPPRGRSGTYIQNSRVETQEPVALMTTMSMRMKAQLAAMIRADLPIVAVIMNGNTTEVRIREVRIVREAEVEEMAIRAAAHQVHREMEAIVPERKRKSAFHAGRKLLLPF